MSDLHHEKHLESYIVQKLAAAGWLIGASDAFDADRAMYPEDLEAWLRATMAPMETQVREHQIHLKRRLESIKRIHQATDTLEERINELTHVENDLHAQIAAIEKVAGDVERLLGGVTRATLRNAA